MRWSYVRTCSIFTAILASGVARGGVQGPVAPEPAPIPSTTPAIAPAGDEKSDKAGPSVAPPAAAPTADAPHATATASTAKSSDDSRALPAIEQRGLGKPTAAKPLLGVRSDAVVAPAPSAGKSLLEPGSWERTGASLLAVLGLIAIIARVFRRLSLRSGLAGAIGAAGRAPSGVMEVLARYPISRGQSLVLLRLDRRVMLCCHTRGGKLGAGGGMTLLTELNDPEEVASILVKTRDASSESMSRRFQSILSRSEHDADRALAAGAPTDARVRAELPAARRVLPKGEAGRAAAYGLDAAPRLVAPGANANLPSGADAADAIRRRLAAMRSQGVTA